MRDEELLKKSNFAYFFVASDIQFCLRLIRFGKWETEKVIKREEQSSVLNRVRGHNSYICIHVSATWRRWPNLQRACNNIVDAIYSSTSFLARKRHRTSMALGTWQANELLSRLKRVTSVLWWKQWNKRCVKKQRCTENLSINETITNKMLESKGWSNARKIHRQLRVLSVFEKSAHIKWRTFFLNII